MDWIMNDELRPYERASIGNAILKTAITETKVQNQKCQALFTEALLP